MNDRTEPDLIACIEPANTLAAELLELIRSRCLVDDQIENLAIAVAACELARWRLLDTDGTPDAEQRADRARALAVDVYETAAAVEIAAADGDEIAELIAAWENDE
jgi:hypothetical protein